MSDDIVKRLRDWAAYPEGRNPAKAPCTESADEIERLRARIAELEEALEFYADRDFNGYRVEVIDYGMYGLSTECGAIVEDAGNLARAALAKGGE